MKLLNNLFSILDREDTEDGFSFRIRLERDCIIYDAHFPGQPITPGVCIIQMAQELFEEETRIKCELTRIKNVKFISIMVPEEGNSFVYSFRKVAEEDGSLKMQVTVTSEDAVNAKLSLVCKRV